MPLNSETNVLKHKLPSCLQRQLRFSVCTWDECVLACKEHLCSLGQGLAQVGQAWTTFSVLYLRSFLPFLRKSQYHLWLSVAQPYVMRYRLEQGQGGSQGSQLHTGVCSMGSVESREWQLSVQLMDCSAGQQCRLSFAIPCLFSPKRSHRLNFHMIFSNF